MMRPSSPGPTGTEMGAPVSLTSWPRTRPSEESIAIVRTVDSPRCWATSRTRRLPPFLVSSAFRIAGRWPSNCTSTTAPMTWVIFPTAFWVVAMSSSLRELKRFRAGDDLDQFFGDHCLTRAVIDERLLANHFAGIAGGVIHRAHACALLGRCVFQKCAEHLHRQITRQQIVENIALVRLVFVSRGRTGFFRLLEHRRDDLLGGRNLRDHRSEAREKQCANIERTFVEQLDN